MVPVHASSATPVPIRAPDPSVAPDGLEMARRGGLKNQRRCGDDVAFDSPTALRPSGLFAVYVGATPISMIRIVPERHRPVEIVSGADELRVLVELRK